MEIGDTAYLRKAGPPPRGIIAVGHVVRAPYLAAHWDKERADDTCWYVDLELSRLQEPGIDKIVSDTELESITADAQQWSPFASGIEIRPGAASALRERWEAAVTQRPATADAPPQKDRASSHQPQNVILYGPPGTGKTYQLIRLCESYTVKESSVPREAWIAQQVAEARWRDVIIAALHMLGGQATVPQIVGHEFVTLKAQSLGRTRNIGATIWAILQENTVLESKTVSYASRRPPHVFDKTASGQWTFAGDWKALCAEQISAAEAWHRGPSDTAAQSRYMFTTFHQAYSYEDFIEGLRPVTDEESGEVRYEIVPGVFRRICRRAKADPTNRYALFIDEINRGNIAKIFGELITLIEPDKRASWRPDGSLQAGLEVTLPYSGDQFGVPSNLDIFGTMNSADRSIALLDTALRRRFRFEHIAPDSRVIGGSLGDGTIEDDQGDVINLRALLDAMNQRIRFLLNADLQLGHAYLNSVRTFADLTHVLLFQLMPLLQEYFYDDWRRIQLVLRDIGPNGEPIEPQIVKHRRLTSSGVFGADHEDLGEMIDYCVSSIEEITPDSIRKIYELGD